MSKETYLCCDKLREPHSCAAEAFPSVKYFLFTSQHLHCSTGGRNPKVFLPYSDNLEITTEHTAPALPPPIRPELRDYHLNTHTHTP